MWRSLVYLVSVAFVKNGPHATSTAMPIDNFPLWHASLRHPTGNIPLPDGEPFINTYTCEIFVCFRNYLFVRALLAKTLKLRRHRKAVRNLSSRFEHDPSTVARVAGAQSFFFSGVDKAISRVSLYEANFVRTYRKNCVYFCCPLLTSTQPRTYTTGRQQNMQRARCYNAAAHKQQTTPCVCDKPICAVLRWLQ